MSLSLENYLQTLRHELWRRGVFGSRVVDEVRSHVLDAAEAEERAGVPAGKALDRAVEKFGSARVLAIQLATDRSLIMQRLLLASALALGILLAYVDSRPTWDDTGVTAGLLLIVTATLGAIAPRRPWLWALCVGLWIPIIEISKSANYGSLLALGFAFAGAYAGMFVRRMVTAS